ncbi:putative ribonuclease H protein [Citrus sinensis]|nr:putative ribonuclease H protein [Citrus sinensis]
MKNTWQLITEPTKLSNQVLLTKYGVQLDEVPTSLSTRYGSHLWKTMGNIWEKTRVGMQWNIGDGKNVRFWWDCWVTTSSPLADCVTQPILNTLLSKRLLNDPIGNGDRNFWHLAWSWKGPQSICVFLWLLLHGRLKTRKELHKRHLVVSTQYDRCGGLVEDILHTLRDCVTARRVRTHEILRYSHQPLLGKQQRVETMIRGKAPTRLCISLNTDGARKGSGHAGASGLIRDFNGNWLMGFTVNLGMCSVLSAGLWGLLHGLRVAWDHGFRRLQVGVDNKSIVHLLERAHPSANENAILVKVIQELLARDWIVHMEHVYKEANSDADFLTSYSLTTPIGLHVLLSPPLAILVYFVMILMRLYTLG